MTEPSHGSPKVYYSEGHRCWYVPVSSELFDSTADKTGLIEPCRVELRDGQLWITRLEADRA
jgi:hypothetical protein